MRKTLRWIALGIAISFQASLAKAENENAFSPVVQRLPAASQDDDPLASFSSRALFRGQSTADLVSFDNAGTFGESGCGAQAAGCDSQSSCGTSCDIGCWRDNTLVWVGADAVKSFGDYRQPPGFDQGYMNSAGVLSGFNTGIALGDSRVRGQIGATYGIYDFKGRDTFLTPSSSEQQTFITGGFYKRSDISDCDRISWGLVYDQFWGHQWGLYSEEVYLGQFRGIVGYALSECDEIGGWGTFHTNHDTVLTGGGGLNFANIRAMNQANAYWRHNWAFGGSTMAYVGAVDSADVASWLVGVLAQAPLSQNTSLYSNVTFALPGSGTGPVGSNELQWNIAAGLQYSFGAKAVSQNVSGQQGLPLQAVGNNGNFLITD